MANYTPVKIAYTAFEPGGGSNDKLTPIIFLHGATWTKETWDVIPQIIADKTKRKPERVEMIFSEDMYIKKIPRKVADNVISFILDLSEAVQSAQKDLNESDALAEAVEFLLKNNKGNVTLSSKESFKKSIRVLKRKSDGGYDVPFNKDPIIRGFEDLDTLMTSPSGQFNGHVYFIYGGASPFAVRSEEEHIKNHFPKAEFIKFVGGSHNLHLEYLDKFVKTILDRL
ncbi:uncharacterized protein [Parasteatoda tepidariorum]|uniref:uncharacterized protein isoform X2 n=1 Tax=Parasteatoda tepidariorum TaxID=114398 RepID=UPI001C718272|nr:uncharacterized protein LOC107455949 isoform X2 [Parasteatoda tepidariorum]